MENISFTIPMDPVILDNTAGMLLNIADEIRAGNTKKSFLETAVEESSISNNVTPIKKQEDNKAARVFGGSTAYSDNSEPVIPEPPVDNFVHFGNSIPPPPAQVKDKSVNIPKPPDLPPPPFPGTKMVSGRVELDVDGRPWDIRIDTKQKTKKKDGRWKLKRGADKAEAQVIIDQLIASMAVQATQARVGTITVPEPPEPETFRDQPIDVLPPPVTTPLTFPQFLAKTTERMQSAFSKAYDTGLKTTLAKKGFADGNILTLMANEELIPEIDTEMDIIWNQLNGIPA